MAGDDAEQRGFAGAVAADEADAFAGFEAETSAVEEGVGAEGKFGIDQGQQGHEGREHRTSTLFATHGTVESVALISDRDTGQPRGFGFVEMSNADAARAIQNLNGHQMDGRALKVNEAQPKTDRPRRAW
jgi:hypothetical protein